MNSEGGSVITKIASKVIPEASRVAEKTFAKHPELVREAKDEATTAAQQTAQTQLQTYAQQHGIPYIPPTNYSGQHPDAKGIFTGKPSDSKNMKTVQRVSQMTGTSFSMAHMLVWVVGAASVFYGIMSNMDRWTWLIDKIPLVKKIPKALGIADEDGKLPVCGLLKFVALGAALVGIDRFIAVEVMGDD